jgi:hypothetical protein
MFYGYMMKKEPTLFNMTIDVLGPVGDTVEKWEIENAKFSQIDFGNLNWSTHPVDGKSRLEHQNMTRYYRGGGPVEITAVITFDKAELIF